MKRHLLAWAVGFALASGPTFAAELPVKTAGTFGAPGTPAIAYNSWTGFYLGINGGYENANMSADTGQKRSANGGFGGGQLGYNYEVASRWVFGAEVDAGVAALNGTFIRPDPLVPTVIIADQQKIDYMGSARLRGGVAFDRWLIYATGGFGWAHATETVGNPGGAAATVMSESHTHTGGVVGGGIEGILAGNWTGRIEYLHANLGSQTYSILPASVRVQSDAVRFGLNYLFR